MPTVPTLDPSSLVTPSQAPDGQFGTDASPALLNTGNQQAAQLNAATGDAVNTAASIQLNAQQLANQVRVNDAVNQLKTTQQALMYAPQTGVTSQTGINAIQRDSGMPLADEYTQKLTDSASQIASTLSGPEQIRMFQEQAGNIATQFHGQTTQWEADQFKQYALSTQGGTIKLASDAVAQNYNNPDLIDQNLQSIKAAAYQAGTISGQAATEIEANTKALTSSALGGAIDTALQKGQISYANGLLQKYGPDMTADDLLKANGKMNSYMGAQAAMNTVQRVFSTVGPALSNSNADRAFNIALGSESNNTQTNPDGTPVTSSKGAIGAAQVEPTTGPEAAQLAGLPWDPNRLKTDKAYNTALGKAYFTKQLQDNGGDLPSAYAAYNAGPGALATAKQKAQSAGAPAAWLQYLPPETQNYVTTNMQAYNSGQGNYTRPTKLDVLNQVRADPVLKAKPEWMAQAVTLAGQQYDEQTAGITQTQEANKANVMRAIDQSKGDISQVSPALLAELNPADVPSIFSYAKSVSEGTNATNPAVYQSLVTNPNTLKTMSDDQFYALKNQLSVDDFKHLAQQRSDLINNLGTNSPGALNLRAVNETLSQRLQSIGINPYPKMTGFNSDPDAVSRVGAIRQYVNQSLLDAQQQTGRKFTEQDINQHIDDMFTKDVTFGHTFSLGPISFQQANTTVPMLQMTADQIPDDVRPKLMADFAAHGVPKPTSGQLLGAYWTMKTAQQKLQGQ